MRTQNDGLQDKMSLESAVTFDPSEDQTRQEFKDEADINWLLPRYGVPVGQQLQYGEADMDLDLQKAYAALDEARSAISRLPSEVLALYGGVMGAFAAASNGHLELPKPPASGDEGSSSAATGGDTPPPQAA